MDEPENLKLSRALAFGCARQKLGGAAFERGKHFVWLEKGGYDVGVLLVNGTKPSTIVPVTDDADLAMTVQEKFGDVHVTCGDPLKLVRSEGRVFATMCFGFNRLFTPKFFNQIVAMLQHGARDGTCFNFALNGGDPEGEELLVKGNKGVLKSMAASLLMSDTALLEDHYSTSTLEEKARIRKLTSTPSGFEEAVKQIRDHIETSMLVLARDSRTAEGKAADQTYNFLRYFRDEVWRKKMGPMPYRVQALERKGQENHVLVFMTRLMRGNLGEKPERFADRLRDAVAHEPRPELTFREDKPGLIEELFEANKNLRGKHPDAFWDMYFSR